MSRKNPTNCCSNCGKDHDNLFREALARALEGPGEEAHDKMIEILRTETHGPDHGAFVIAAVAAWLVNCQGVPKDLILQAFEEYIGVVENARARLFSSPVAKA